MVPENRFRRATFAIAIWAVLAVLPAAAQTLPQCWAPDRLRAQPGENAIRKNVRAAFVPPPKTPVAPLPPVPLERRGAIRRVDLPPGSRRIALTFDLCEQPYEVSGYQGDIVDFLRDEKISATFFAGGKWLLTHDQRAQQLLADSRIELANHAWEHRNFRLLSGTRLTTEIDAAQRAYATTRANLSARNCQIPGGGASAELAVPQQPRLFRFPFGACSSESLRAVNDHGLLAIQWDVSAGDPWKGQTVERMTDHVLKRTRPGSIIIFHATGRGWKTGEALPRIIKGLRARGFEFVTVTQLLDTAGAKPVISPTCYDAKPGDSDRYDDVSRRLEALYDNYYTSVGGRRP